MGGMSIGENVHTNAFYRWPSKRKIHKDWISNLKRNKTETFWLVMKSGSLIATSNGNGRGRRALSLRKRSRSSESSCIHFIVRISHQVTSREVCESRLRPSIVWKKWVTFNQGDIRRYCCPVSTSFQLWLVMLLAKYQIIQYIHVYTNS